MGMRPYVEEVAEAYQVPVDLPANLALAASSAASAGRVSVRGAPDWHEPTSAYYTVAADSGERKSPVHREVTAPLEDLQRELADAAAPVIAKAEVEREILEERLKLLKKEIVDRKKSDADRKDLMEQATSLAEDLATKSIPESPRVLCDDITPEALASLLADNDGIMAQFSTEGGVFQILAGRYHNGQLAIDIHLKSYSGDPIYVDRKGRKAEHISKPLLTVGLTVQPDVIRSLADTPAFRGRGLLARFLYAVPKSWVGYRKLKPHPVSEGARQRYREVIRSIAALGRETDDEPHLLKLSAGAEGLFDAYRQELEVRLRPGGALRDIRDWVLKLSGAVLRLAGILHLIEDYSAKRPWEKPIDAETRRSAIALGRYYTEHALVAFGLMGVDGRVAEARETWETIVKLVRVGKSPTSFTQRDLWQHVRRRFRNVGELSEVLQTLEDMNYIRMITTVEADRRGRQPSPCYKVNPLVLQGGDDDGPGGNPNSEYKVYSVYGAEDGKTDEMAEGSDKNSEVPTVAEQPPVEPSSDGSSSSSVESTDGNSENSTSPARTQSTQSAQNSVSFVAPSVCYITEAGQAQRVVGELLNERVIGFDIESTGLDYFLDKPRLLQAATRTTAYVFDLYRVPLETFAPVLRGGPVKVIQNAKFEANFLSNNKGGVVPEPLFDTMLADQVLHNRSYGRGLQDLAREYLDIELEKDEQTSEWAAERLTKGQIEYAATDAAVLLPLYDRLSEEVEELGLARTVDLENRLVGAISWMESRGVGFDYKQWRELVDIATERASSLGQELTQMAKESGGEVLPEVNWNSAKQVLNVLWTLGLKVENTRQETLESAQDQHAIVQILLDYREARKKVGTYGRKWLRFVHPVTGRIHPNWRQIGAATGRMACAGPNLQNLPRDPAYRACFRPGPGHVFVKADYSQIELRVAAEMAPDARMKQAFIEGKDLHATTATYLLGKEETDGVTPDERQLAKAVNFGLIFGMGGRTLGKYAQTSFRVELDEGEAVGIREQYFKAYPGIRNWQQLQGRKAETRTVLGRQRILDGDRYYTARLNSPIQGTGADGLKLALVKMWESRDDVDAFPVLAIHDEIVIEVPEERAQDTGRRIVTDSLPRVYVAPTYSAHGGPY
ncbi:MAG: DNA polymerase [Dehalococcoidia bacterium]|nr:DNA polymerase [Dehalococcoidia bacterium]